MWQRVAFVGALALLCCFVVGDSVAGESLRESWDDLGRAAASEPITFKVSLREHNRAEFDRVFAAVTTPGSKEYGRYRTVAEMAALLAPPVEHVARLTGLLTAAGLEVEAYHTFVEASGPVEAVDRLFGTEMHAFAHKQRTTRRILRSLVAPVIPEEISDVTAFIVGIADFPFAKRGPRPRVDSSADTGNTTYVVPQSIQALYGIPEDYHASRDTQSTQGVVEFGETAGISQDDLEVFMGLTDLPTNVSLSYTVGNFEWDPRDPIDGESTLDVQYMMGIAVDVPTSFWVVNGWIYDFTTLVQERSVQGLDIPLVFSVSYGWAESQQVDYIHNLNISLFQSLSLSHSFSLSLSLRLSHPLFLLSPSLPLSISPSLPLSLSPSLPLPLSPSLPLSLSPSLPLSLSPSLPLDLSPSISRLFSSSLPISQSLKLAHFELTIAQCLVAGMCSDVGWDSSQYVAACSTGFQMMGAAGITVVVSSGDAGAATRANQRCSNVTVPIQPDYPASERYITSVGGTMLQNGGTELPNGPTFCYQDGIHCAGGGVEVVCSVPNALITSGGGFSNFSPQNLWQSDAVSAWMQSDAIQPPSQFWNPSGRAYPDVSGLAHNYMVVSNGYIEAVDGTSASAPVLGAIFALVNDRRLSSGLPPLGFVTPVLYDMAAQGYSESYNDVVDGTNCGTQVWGILFKHYCTTFGYGAGTEWDPTTGWGTPKNWLNSDSYLLQDFSK